MIKPMKCKPAAMSLAIFVTCTALCQGQTATPSGFEVASIKPSDPAATGTQYGLSPGGPGWLDTQRYDIVAKGNDTDVSDDEVKKNDEQRRGFKTQFLLKV